jgi:hypothetical protein
MITLIASLLGVGGVAGAVLRIFGFAGVKKAAHKIPPKVWLFLAIAIALGLAVWFIDHRGYQRAQEEERLRIAERQELTRAIVQEIDGRLDRRLLELATQTAGQIQTIDTEGKTVVQPIITREILRDRSLADPSRCLSPGLLAAVNAARGYLLDERLAGTPGSANPASVPAAGKSR